MSEEMRGMPNEFSGVVLPRWLIWAIIIGMTAFVWFGCQQPFYVPQGSSAKCPNGQLKTFVKDKGWICPDTTAVAP